MTSSLPVICSCLAVDEAETARCAATLAAVARGGDIYCLIGDLGAGKTSFCRSFIRALAGPGERVVSPSFTMVQIYRAAGIPGISRIWHVDLYRVADPSEIIELGFDDVTDSDVMLVEWPDRAPQRFPGTGLEIVLAFCDDPDARRITYSGGPAWARRLADCAAMEAS